MLTSQAAADTIFALATGSQKAAIAILRVSGPNVRPIAETLLGRVPVPRLATLARVRHPQTGETLDEALALFFEADRSELGEDGLELHVHGSPAVVSAVLGVLATQPGARPAQPGEFARRAFANGRVDLAQLEGLADLIDAETQAQRRQAQRQVSGALRDAVTPWREALLLASAEIEAVIDFADEVDVGASTRTTIDLLLAPLRAGLRRELMQAPAAERVRNGVVVVIAGPPNAGKSSLLNALVRREAAIVSTIAGTTRDPIEVHLELDGQAVTLIDTAGLHESADPIEQIGIARARDRADRADLVLWLTDDKTHAPAFLAPVWRIASKADICSEGDKDGSDDLAISATTGENLVTLVARLITFAKTVTTASEQPLLTRQRHKDSFVAALTALDRIAASPHLSIELVAEDLRTARFALDRLLGKVDVEDILGSIFSRFCIGK